MSSNRRVWYRLPDGSASPTDALVETPTGWARPAPIHCPSGHPFTPGRMVVGWYACRSTADEPCNGHVAHRCLVCNEAVLRPKPTSTCELIAFDGRPGNTQGRDHG